MKFKAMRIRGMRDILPNEFHKWEYIQSIMEKEGSLYGFNMIRTPVLESTNLFERSAGEATDVVQKEMYTFNDKGGRSVSMRPEGTAGVLRAVLENNLNQKVLPQKLMYLSSCYRYEKPQAGRLREFYQFGFEIFGGNAPSADVEVICLAHSIFRHLGIKGIKLHINAICCSACRDIYEKKIREHFNRHKQELCETCNHRLEKNPMRIFDCKEQKCVSIYSRAPLTVANLCPDCNLHFENVKNMLTRCGIRYIVNPLIVRGLDYYTKIVFEFITKIDGIYTTVCGGGRDDNLSREIGGPDMTAVGMGIGMDRLLLLMENQESYFPLRDTCDVFIAPMGREAKLIAVKIAEDLRRNLIRTETDIVRRTIKPNLRYANKIETKYCIILGNSEIENNMVNVKDMSTGKEFEVPLGDEFISQFLAMYTRIEEEKLPEKKERLAKLHAKKLLCIREIEEKDKEKNEYDIGVVDEELNKHIMKEIENAAQKYALEKDERDI